MSIKQAARRVAESVAVDAVLEIYENAFPNATLTEVARTSIKRFLQDLPCSDPMEAMQVACEHMADEERLGDSRVFRYFCGICWRKIRGPPPTNAAIG